jgi:hypothetical protein
VVDMSRHYLQAVIILIALTWHISGKADHGKYSTGPKTGSGSVNCYSSDPNPRTCLSLSAAQARFSSRISVSDGACQAWSDQTHCTQSAGGTPDTVSSTRIDMYDTSSGNFHSNWCREDLWHDETCPVTYECSDGIDNDNDGLTDYPSDPGCTSAQDDTESNAVCPIEGTPFTQITKEPGQAGWTCWLGCALRPQQEIELGMTITATSSNPTETYKKYNREYTGAECQVPDPAPEDVEESDEFTTPAGDVIATEPDTAEQCIIINGVERCYKLIPQEQCEENTFNGDVICTDESPTPPAPDNGTPGEPATPDLTIEETDANGTPTGDGAKYYNPSTKGGSTGLSPGGAAGEGDGTSGIGSCDPATMNCCQGDECDDRLTGGLTCSAPPSCSGSPIQCYHSRKLWETQCALAKPSDNDIEAAANASLGGDPTQGSLVPQIGDAFDVSTLFDPEAASASCLDDMTLSLTGELGGSFRVPLSEWCFFFQTIGLLVLASAALAAVRIYAAGFS